MSAEKAQSILTKRYARSRLYDTTNQRYVSTEQLKRWTVQGVAFAVIDTETGEDVTHIMLA